MNAYERVEAVLMAEDGGVLTADGVRLPSTFVVRGVDPEAALLKLLRTRGVRHAALVPIARVGDFRVYIGRAVANGALREVTVAELDRALKACAVSAPAIARLAALTVAKHARKLTGA